MKKIFDFIGRDITQIQMTSNNKVRVWFGLRSQEMTLTEFNYLMIKKKQRDEKKNQRRELTELIIGGFAIALMFYGIKKLIELYNY